MVWMWLGRAGTFLMTRFGKKKLFALAATFGGVIVARPEGGYREWLDEKKDDVIEDAGKPIVAAVAGAGAILVIMLLLSRRKGGD